MNAERVDYLDSSAIVKLVVQEPESKALRQYLRRRHVVASSALARAEVNRAVLPLGEGAIKKAHEVLGHIDLIRINNRVLAEAGSLQPATLRTLDAIHLATAALLGDSLSRLVCYDDRLSAAARALGWTVHSPG